MAAGGYGYTGSITKVTVGSNGEQQRAPRTRPPSVTAPLVSGGSPSSVSEFIDSDKSASRQRENLQTPNFDVYRRSYLQLVKFTDPNAAIGMAARLMMDRPAFSQRQFGSWMRVIEGQAQRGHQIFVVDENQKAVGYVGYAFPYEYVAERWLKDDYLPLSEDCWHGDCVIINSLVANNQKVLAKVVEAVRRIGEGKKAIYFKRFHAEKKGVRKIRISVTGAWSSHVARANARSLG